MGNVQPNYNATLARGYEGQIATEEPSNVISRVCEPASIGFGLAVIQGTEDNEVALGVGGLFVGLSTRDIALPAANEDVYLAGNTLGVLVKGTMFCKAIAAVAAGDPVYRTSTGTLTNVPGARSATAEAAEGNTGNGAMGAITVTGDLPHGDYVLDIISEAGNAGGFRITGPDGAVFGPLGNVATAYNFGGLAFTLADGSEDFDIGDSFVITVAGGNARIPGARWIDTLAQNAIGRVRIS